MTINIKILITELYKAFQLFNKELYNNELPEPSILIQNRGNKKNVMGWCTTSKEWNDTINKEKKYEIAIISDYLYRGMLPVLSTLLHEMAHLYDLQNGIQDVSRSGTYHNKNFKTVAESHGLLIEHDKGIGWSLSKLQSSTIDLIKKSNINEEAFSLIKIIPKVNDDEEGEEGEDTKSKSSTRKYVCPKCGNIIRASKEVNVICGDCNVPFVLECL